MMNSTTRFAFTMTALALAVVLAGCQTGPGAAAADRHTIVPAEQVEWEPAPPALEPGAQIAVLDGDPTEDGHFTVRLRMPDSYLIAPHRHPHVERVTVLEGTLHLGMGEQLDPQATEALPAGSYFYLPPELPHFAFTEGETVIQISADGPFDAAYIDPGDDPRNR